MTEERWDRYIQYIKNTGGSPKIEEFDDDWDPIGPMLRQDMLAVLLIEERDGKIFLIQTPEDK